MKSDLLRRAMGALVVAALVVSFVYVAASLRPVDAFADDAPVFAAQTGFEAVAKAQKDARMTGDADEASLNASDGDDMAPAAADDVDEATATTESDAPSIYYSADDFSVNAYNGQPFMAATEDYFHDAIFIGNSRMRGFVLYAQIPDLNSITYIGWLVGEFFTEPYIYMYGQPMSGADAVRLTDFNKAYLNFGFNDLEFDDAEAFVRDYRLIVDFITEYRPDAIVYINSILPVHPSALAEYSYAEQEHVVRYNDALRKMAIDAGCVFLDSQSVFLDDDGFMNMNYSWEGVHVHEQGMTRLRDYWLSHVVAQ